MRRPFHSSGWLWSLATFLCIIAIVHSVKFFYPVSKAFNDFHDPHNSTRVALVSAISNSGGKYSSEVFQLSLENKLTYARLHRYDFFVCNFSVKEEWHPIWGKLMALEDVMGRNYQWTIYLDIDLIITNVNTKMEEFFLDENFDIVLPIDCNGINTGVEMFRGTDSNYRLLRSLWTFTEYKQKYFQEQTALWLAIGRDRNVARRVKLIPPGVLQSYQDASCGAKFEDGDFIWHFPGILSSEELADNMKRYTKLGTLSNTFDIPKVEGNTCNCTLLT